ncbi:MAG: hypothetical protein H0X62_00500 [Bacteroidetes bacterium]|nr:hypothetical protein [Bacteroidota bacterium]
MSNTQNSTSAVEKPSISSHEQWFDNFISNINEGIKVDKRELEDGDASTEKRSFYQSLITGDTVSALSISRNSISQVLFQNIILDYLSTLPIEKIKTSVNKLALDLSTNKILIWIEIKDDSQETENELLRAESKINAKYYSKSGICIDSTIIEESDRLSTPPHYSEISF